MIHVRCQINIACSPAKVWEFVTDPAKSLQWQSALVESHGERGLPAGSTGSVVVAVLGQRLTSKYEVLENDGRSYYRAKSRQGPVQYTTTQMVQPMRGGCRVIYETSIDAGTVFRLAEAALESIAQARFDADLTTLKVIMESESTV